MTGKRLSVPEPWGYGQAYELSYKLACEQLARIPDIEEQCRKSGAEYQVTSAKKAVIIQYLNRPYQISIPDGDISLADSGEAVLIRDKLLILHYFNRARGTPPTNRLIAFQELPEGTIYFPTFSKRTIKPLLDSFGKEPVRLLEFGENLGGRKVDYGDAAVSISALPRVPITIVLWRGDDEFPPHGNVLFDANITDYLPTEDITVLSETIVWKLVRLARGG